MYISSNYNSPSPPKEGFADLDEEAGRRRGETWFNSNPTLLYAERLLRADNEDDLFSECKGPNDAIKVLLLILLPMQAADPEIVAQSWDTLRGDAHRYSQSVHFVRGFYDGARTAAWRRYNIRTFSNDWVKKLSPQQMIHLCEFADKYGDDASEGKSVWPECCHSAYEFCFYVTHGQLPSLSPRELSRHVRAWFFDSIEHESQGWFSDAFVEVFVQDVVAEVYDGDCTPEVEAAYAAIQSERNT